MKELIELRSVAGITELSAVAPGRSHPRFVLGKLTGATALGLLSVLVNQQLTFDCGNLGVYYAVAVQLTTASEGDVLYLIGEYFRLG